jgi:hypothetical protein
VKDCEDDNHLTVEKEKYSIGEIGKVEASNVSKTYGVATRFGHEQLIRGMDCGDKPLAQTRTMGFVPFRGLRHIGLNDW